MSERAAAYGEDTGFEGNDAEEAPFGVGEVLEEGAFVVGGGVEFFVEALEMGFVGGGVVGFEEDGLAGESGFDGVVGGDELALSGDSRFAKWGLAQGKRSSE